MSHGSFIRHFIWSGTAAALFAVVSWANASGTAPTDAQRRGELAANGTATAPVHVVIPHTPSQAGRVLPPSPPQPREAATPRDTRSAGGRPPR